jgi:hypothetical protein
MYSVPSVAGMLQRMEACVTAPAPPAGPVRSMVSVAGTSEGAAVGVGVAVGAAVGEAVGVGTGEGEGEGEGAGVGVAAEPEHAASNSPAASDSANTRRLPAPRGIRLGAMVLLCRHSGLATRLDWAIRSE